MSYILVDELVTTLTQEVVFSGDTRQRIDGMKLKIYMHNTPAGTFTVSLKDGATTLASDTFTSAEIKSDLDTSDNYAYLWKVININVPVNNQAYDVVLSHSGYTYSSTSFIGWIFEHENAFTTDEDIRPYGIRIYNKQKQELI